MAKLKPFPKSCWSNLLMELMPKITNSVRVGCPATQNSCGWLQTSIGSHCVALWVVDMLFIMMKWSCGRTQCRHEPSQINHHVWFRLKPSPNYDGFMGCQHYIKIHLCLNIMILSWNCYLTAKDNDEMIDLVNSIWSTVLHFLAAYVDSASQTQYLFSLVSQDYISWMCVQSNKWLLANIMVVHLYRNSLCVTKSFWKRRCVEYNHKLCHKSDFSTYIFLDLGPSYSVTMWGPQTI